MTRSKRGVTLMELLIVVLIIGILTAVAVPMYKHAALKSQFSTVMPPTKSLAQAQEVFYLNNGEYAEDKEELDLSVPDTAKTTITLSTKRNYKYVMGRHNSIPGVRYIVYQKNSRRFADNVHCEAAKTDDAAKWLCEKGLGGTPITGSISGANYLTYLLSGNAGTDKFLREDCAVGQYDNNGTCKYALPGHYADEGDLIKCPAGTYAANYGNTSCTTCPAGQFASAGSGGCKNCPPGTYATGGNETCIACPAGTYAANYGNGACKKCGAGQIPTANSGSCENCPPGTYAASGDTTCTACPAGMYAANYGNGTCKKCGTGQIPAANSGRCENCPPGTYAASGDTTCTTCPAGMYAANYGNGTCKKCGTGQIPTANSGSCSNCPPGTYAASGDTTCTTCPAGTYAANYGNGTCTKCPAGAVCGAGANKYTWCPSGTHPNEDQSACI